MFYPVGRNPRYLEMAELSSIDVCPVISPFKQGRNGPSAEFFEKLEHIRYMCMPHSHGLYCPLGSPEPSLSDLFDSSMLGGSSIASVVDGVARACMDDDSIDTEAALVHIDSDGTITSICLGPDGTINSIN